MSVAEEPIFGRASRWGGLRRATERAGVTESLHERIPKRRGSSWEAVHAAFLRREVSKEDVRRFVERVHREAGHSYLEMARLMRLEPEYRKLVNFLHHHDLRVGR